MTEIGGKVEALRRMFYEPIGSEWEGKTIGYVHKKLEEIMGRPVWTHEMGYPEMLIEELRHGKPMDAFRKSVEAIAREKPVVLVVKD